jgi:hypothetical protein
VAFRGDGGRGSPELLAHRLRLCFLFALAQYLFDSLHTSSARRTPTATPSRLALTSGPVSTRAPRRPLPNGVGLAYAAYYFAVGQHVEIVITPQPMGYQDGYCVDSRSTT